MNSRSRDQEQRSGRDEGEGSSIQGVTCNGSAANRSVTDGAS